MRILLVEDAPRVRESVTELLRAAGYRVAAVGDYRSAIAAVEGAPFDAAIVDIGLPDRSGLELCRALRSMERDLPVLVLTARTSVEDRVAGLDAGADDYLGKPFAPAELEARLRALLRRGPRFIESTRRFGDLTIDRDRREVRRGEELVPLTARELEVVALLAWADGRVVPRDRILEGVWGEASDRTSASLEVHIARIRRKVSGRGPDSCIRTVREIGYAWTLARSS
jgi:two-component system OmpR family response regulator